jgi:hypothetical protein
MNISDRIKAFLGHDPKAAYSASYEEMSATTSRCTFLTPARGEREHVVNLSVDEIEDLILAAEQER